jgi:hypothetical protein
MKHLEDNNMSYWGHWKEAMTYSLVLFVHAWIPNLFPTYVSDRLKLREKKSTCKSKKCTCKSKKA